MNILDLHLSSMVRDRGTGCLKSHTEVEQNSRALRRLAVDHGALHNQPLPPNYLFPPASSTTDDLTQLDVLLAGPTHTPFAAGLFKLHLTIPPKYPQEPPTANFRTPIFHPNVDPNTGGVCVETLKRDWDSKLTLRDVLITISCLLIQPNPDSALNAEGGALIQEDYNAFARRAELMTSIHAVVPRRLQEAVKQAQGRGHEEAEAEEEVKTDNEARPDAPVRRRRPTARQKGTAVSRRSDGSPSGDVARRRPHPGSSNQFIVQTGTDDVFGVSMPPLQEQSMPVEDDDSSMIDADQENDQSRSPGKAKMPAKTATPRRPHGAVVPLGELMMEEVLSDTEEDEAEAEAEYPPSPRKSTSKSPIKRRQQQQDTIDRPESSRDAAARRAQAPNITPPNNLVAKPLAADSPFSATPSPRKTHIRPQTPAPGRAPLFPLLSTPKEYGGVFRKKSPSSSEKNAAEKKRKAELDAKLWKLCGHDIGRWNRGDFDGEPFKKKAGRW